MGWVGLGFNCVGRCGEWVDVVEHGTDVKRVRVVGGRDTI